MNEILTTRETKRALAPAKAPAKAWRCLFRLPERHAFECMTCKRVEIAGPGERFSCAVFPSKEIAEQRVLELMRHPDFNVSRMEFLGAFPCEDA